MTRTMTEDERDEFFALPHVAVLSVAADDVYAVVSRYVPEADARAFAEAETTDPSGTFVLFTGRPVRWLTNDFGEADD
ncbi:hypothetical protein ALI22I_27625 [Saccharothrix sp. ALI-22-I]|uniref:hypothetical protein n=1 Tax=Saccharothrix sp. ALI-22-I TaxID=1933778 RepID=UPI00097CB8BC|nr:hypothetical protein [Saccharothrix sp. ALI-22-I]ONI85561.1 hypothetical protein ALI22I_27625 [Saccharothrix sp. ALI-22-I]